jgi:hypothetical protein
VDEWGAINPDEIRGLGPLPDDVDRDLARDAICSLEPSWKPPTTALSFDGISWRPDLVGTKGKVLHLALDGDLPNALIRRMQAANRAGQSVTIALGIHGADIRTLLAVRALDSRVIAVDWEGRPTRVRSYRSVADWIASERIFLSPPDLQALASAHFKEALAAEPHKKGRLYEEVLCLVFSQVSWLTVDEHAFRNATEEIDLVLGIHAAGHVAELAKGAIAVATAKNEATPTGSDVVKYLKEQIANRHKRCKLGFLCSATTITSDARTEILRGSQSSELVLVPIEGDDLQALINAADALDEQMLILIRRAVSS